MNNQILKLAQQAGISFDIDPGTSGPEVSFDRQEDFEKFAALLVKECIATIEAESQDAGDEWEYRPQHVIDSIKKRFELE